MLKIKIVGGGCSNCEKLALLCDEVITEHKLNAELVKVTDLNLFAELGVFITPGLVVNDKVLSQGKIPVKSTLENWILKENSL